MRANGRQTGREGSWRDKKAPSALQNGRKYLNMRIPDIKYVIASTTVLLLLTSCGTLNSFSSPGTGQNAKVSTIRKSMRSCPCLYAVYPNQAVTALAPDTSGDWVQIRQIAGSNT